MVAYFSAEFGLSDALPIYSGGLGILAGDHLKASSDLGIPLVGVGLAYREGYFHQEIGEDGWQREHYIYRNLTDLPLTRVTGSGGEPLSVEIRLPEGPMQVAIWRAMVGAVPLLLLDTDQPENQDGHRLITRRLYGGDIETRILQEIVLGIGGVRALEAAGYTPEFFHINEGHAAFLLLERLLRTLHRDKIDLESARRRVGATSLFTTHTPVAAGFDLFPPALMDRYRDTLVGELGIDIETLMSWGRRFPGPSEEPFNMALFAVRHTDRRNGVSRLHGAVSRRMWHDEWSGVPEDEVPIGHITNGVHTPTWAGPETTELLDRFLGPGWARDPEHADWSRIETISDAELRETHDRAKVRMIEHLQRRVALRLERLGRDPREAENGPFLDPTRLTVGFARRFAPYKRGTLLLRDHERLRALITHPEHPVQFVFAGKAHPANHEGKLLIQELVRFAEGEGFADRFLFLEDYDMTLAAALVQGVDVWLNTPTRSLEASGTSGMKAALNGGLQLSILDGWWDEAFATDFGWAIGGRDPIADPDPGQRDAGDAGHLYHLLETEVAPRFYAERRTGSAGWAGMMKRSISRIGPVMSAHRMVREYAERYYGPAAGKPTPE